MQTVHNFQKTCKKPLLLPKFWYAYVHNDPVNLRDLWGFAPRNLTEEQREKYKKYVSSYEVSKSPAGVVCSTLGAYIASSAMEAATGEKEYYKNLQHDGEKLTSYFGIYAEDYSSEKDGSVNFTFYTDSEGNKDNVFNSPNVEVGTIGVFGTKKPLTVDEDGNRTGWTGHIITVTDVIRDTDGKVTSIKIVQGHSSRDPDTDTLTNQTDLQAYINGTGPFLGWGEIGPGSANINNTKLQQEEGNTCEKYTK